MANHETPINSVESRKIDIEVATSFWHLQLPVPQSVDKPVAQALVGKKVIVRERIAVERVAMADSCAQGSRGDVGISQKAWDQRAVIPTARSLFAAWSRLGTNDASIDLTPVTE